MNVSRSFPRVIGAFLFSAIVAVLPVTDVVHAAGKADGFVRSLYVFPPELVKQGLTFAGQTIPLQRRDVQERILDQVNYLLMDRRSGVMEWFDRMAVYGPMMMQELKSQGLPEDLLYLAALLGDMSPNPPNRGGGVGWWLLGTINPKKNNGPAPWLVTDDWDDRRDPMISTKIFGRILQGLSRKNRDQDMLWSIAAFADGAEKIDKINQDSPGFSIWDVVLPPASDSLIPRLIALKIVDANRQLYGVAVEGLNPLAYDYLDRVKLSKDLPLHLVAKWSGISPRSLWEINPGVDPSTGVLPKVDKKNTAGVPLRVPAGMGTRVKNLMISEGYLVP